MRTLNTALTTVQQQRSYAPAVKIVLTYGETSYTIEEDRILSLKHIEEPWSVNAREVQLNNADGYFTSLDLKGYSAVISWGMVTPSGKLYSATSPLVVTWQQLNSSPGSLTCLLTMLGIPDLLALDSASYNYLPDTTSTMTVKDLIDDLAGASMTGFSHCEAWTVDYDSGAASYLTYKPKDSFRVYTGDNRLGKFKELLSYTKCVERWGDDGHIHILKPTTSGTTYDYQYSLTSGHAFFSKAYRKSLVLPNKVTVQSPIYTYGDSPEFSGSHTSAASYALLPKEQFISANVESDSEAASIAEAIIFRYELAEQQGAAEVPMNCGAEVFDYIKVTDERENDSRTGNIGALTRTFNPLKKIYTIDFNMGDPPRLRHIKELAAAESAARKEKKLMSFHAILLPVPGTLAAKEDASYQLVVPFEFNVYVAYANVRTAPTGFSPGDDLIIQVNYLHPGDEIWNELFFDDTSESGDHRLKLEPGQTTDSTHPKVVPTVLPVNTIITVDVVQGNGEELIVELRGTAEMWREE